MATARKGAKLTSHSSINSQFEFRGGSILSMELINFMCHSHLRVDLRDNVNFIVGNNGSKSRVHGCARFTIHFTVYVGGKSAILTALTICLGARAKATDRGSSAESLIKEGTAEARVSLNISNYSEFPFKPELYGDAVIIERRIKRGAAGSYRVRSGDGKRTVSERKDEIEALCDHYNIQVSNPLAILTQDTAKKFLVNSTPANLYSFFMEATNLKQIMNDYNEAEARMFKMQDSLDEARSYWPQKMEEIENLELELKALEVVRDSQRKIASLETEIAWSKVIGSEKVASEIILSLFILFLLESGWSSRCFEEGSG
jgi:chromosome segregation ATPase